MINHILSLDITSGFSLIKCKMLSWMHIKKHGDKLTQGVWGKPLNKKENGMGAEF